MSTPTGRPEPVVRPYALTGGRTRTQHSYPLEALVATTSAGEGYDSARTPEAQAICDLCGRSLSVAEVAASLDVPLGVARVLIGDLVGAGLVVVHEPSDDAPDSGLLERVLGGLRKL
jgi:hypothetical protein